MFHQSLPSAGFGLEICFTQKTLDRKHFFPKKLSLDTLYFNFWVKWISLIFWVLISEGCHATNLYFELDF